MKDVTAREYREAGRFGKSAKELIEFSLQQLFKDQKKLNGEVVTGCLTYEELIFSITGTGRTNSGRREMSSEFINIEVALCSDHSHLRPMVSKVKWIMAANRDERRCHVRKGEGSCGEEAIVVLTAHVEMDSSGLHNSQ